MMISLVRRLTGHPQQQQNTAHSNDDQSSTSASSNKDKHLDNSTETNAFTSAH